MTKISSRMRQQMLELAKHQNTELYKERRITFKNQRQTAFLMQLEANFYERTWWSQSGSNRRPSACKADALPAELWPLKGALRHENGGSGRI